MSLLRYGLIRAKSQARQVTGVSRALVQRDISFYPDYLRKFEARYAEFVGTEYALSFCNGTSAIEAGLFAAGVGPGDEVIVPSCTFHASIDPIVTAGATPIFADVDEETLALSATEVAGKITESTKAVIVVHLFGAPADMAALRAVLKGRGIVIIEDASHAHGARVGDKMVGSLSDIGAFSLQGSKAVAGGEGGIACTDSEEFLLRMSLWGHFTRHADRFHEIGAEAFRDTGLGHKRRMAPVSALIANGDLAYLERANQIMRDNTARLDAALDDVEGFRGLSACEGGAKGGFFGGYPLVVDRPGVTAADAIAALRSGGFRTSAYPFPLHHKLQAYANPAMRRAVLERQDAAGIAHAPTPHLPVTERAKTQLLLLSRRYLVTLNNRKLNAIRTLLDRL
jgi:dTDP-4-amino-4,6-dideoxygalactose transaminase